MTPNSGARLALKRAHKQHVVQLWPSAIPNPTNHFLTALVTSIYVLEKGIFERIGVAFISMKTQPLLTWKSCHCECR